MAGVGSTSQVHSNMRCLGTLEASANKQSAEGQATTKKAAQKLTNFRAYLHKSSVAGCFVDLLEMTNGGVMTEADLYPSGGYKKSAAATGRRFRAAGLGGSSSFRSRPPNASRTAGHGGLRHGSQAAPLDPSCDLADVQSDEQKQQQQKQRRWYPRGIRGRIGAPATAGDGGGIGGGDSLSSAFNPTSSSAALGGGAQQLRQRGRGRGRENRRQRPSTALGNPSQPLLAHAPDAPLNSRNPRGRFSGTIRARTLASSPPRITEGRGGGDGGGGSGSGQVGSSPSTAVASFAAVGGRDSRLTNLDVQRTQWMEGDVIDVGGGGWVEVGAANEQVAGLGPETDDKRTEEDTWEDDGDSVGASAPWQSASCAPGSPSPPKSPILAWGKAMGGITTTVSKVKRMDHVAQRALTTASGAEERRQRAIRARAVLIAGEQLRAQELLSKSENRKQAAVEAAALAASQRGLLEAITLVLATKRMWAEGQKLAERRQKAVVLGVAARTVQKAFKAHSSRRMLKVLLAIRKVQLQFHVGINIRRKKMAATRMVWFLTTGNGGAKARPRKVIRHFIYQVRRCQRAARDWLACRAASIEAVCRLWTRIESEIRRELGDELDRAKRVWMKNALRTGEDSQMHGQWRELKAKTRSLVARIDRLEGQMERQQKRDKAARLLAARATLERRQALGGVKRGSERVRQVDSAENLRTSTVASGKRLAIIRSNLNTKFALHLQGGGRGVKRIGSRVVGEMDAWLLIQGESSDAPRDEENSEGGPAAAHASRSMKRRSRALIYTGNLGRPWEQIVEDTVMQDFRLNAVARKDSMPYLKYSVVLSVATALPQVLTGRAHHPDPSNPDGPSVVFAAAVTGGNTGRFNDSAVVAADGRGGTLHQLQSRG